MEPKYKKDGRYFTKLFHDQMNTPIWKELSAYDVFVYTELLSKRTHGLGDAPDTFILTPIMMRGRISVPRFYKSISNLIKLGFIEISEHGGIGTEGVQRANIYVLSTKWQLVLGKRKDNPSFLLDRPCAPRYTPNKKGVNTRKKVNRRRTKWEKQVTR